LIEGVPPCPRGGHSATLSGASIVIFGGHYYAGKTKGYIYLNDTYVLDVNANRWHVITSFLLNIPRNLKFQEHPQEIDIIIQQFWQGRGLSYLEVKGKNVYFEIFMP
jgi:hypothetical protein